MTAEQVIALLSLAPHPDGGWFRETARDERTDEAGRSICTTGFLLLKGDQERPWGQVEATEIWQFQDGAPLVLSAADTTGQVDFRLGPDASAGERPQLIMPAEVWRKAASLGAWTLVGYTVAPTFQFEGMSMAPRGWRPEAKG